MILASYVGVWTDASDGYTVCVVRYPDSLETGDSGLLMEFQSRVDRSMALRVPTYAGWPFQLVASMLGFPSSVRLRMISAAFKPVEAMIVTKLQ